MMLKKRDQRMLEKWSISYSKEGNAKMDRSESPGIDLLLERPVIPCSSQVIKNV